MLGDHDGIGTEATRAEIIQTLKDREYIETVKKKLRSTSKGRQLITALPDEIKDPGTTALMEQKLSSVEAAETPLSAYLDSQALFVTRQVELARHAAVVVSNRNVATCEVRTTDNSGVLVDCGQCPECGKLLRLRRSKHGAFIGCSSYPECNHINRAGKGSFEPPSGEKRPKSVLREDIQCPDCGNPMVERRGRKGPFLGCSGFPGCRGTRPVQAIHS